jgi:hypothetical protein
MMRVIQRRRDLERLVSLVAGCDPVGVTGEEWSQSGEADAMFQRIVAGSRGVAVTAAGTTPRRRGKGPAVLAVAMLIAGAGVAAASQFLGGPAPSQVKEDLAAVDQGMPSDLRYNPDVRGARLVAQADGTSLYYASLASGGYCSEMVVPTGPAGAICVPGQSMGQEPIHVTVPFTDPLTTSSPFVVGGRVNVSGVTSLQAIFADGTKQSITLGNNGFFVFAVAGQELADAHLHGVRLAATNLAGSEMASVAIPPTDLGNPSKQDAMQPIFVSTISTQDDLTKVLGVEGRVNVPGAASLELRYPDGTMVAIPIRSDGHYRYDLPERRTGDLFEKSGWLIARDASGDELARTPVAAVAYWRVSP